MGFLSHVSTVIAPARLRAAAGNPADPFYHYYGSYVPPEWYGGLSAAGIPVTPELALTLAAFAGGVRRIAIDLATTPLQTLRKMPNGGKERVQYFYGDGIDTSGGISSLAYMLRWQPNFVQTATEFWYSQAAQLLLREVAYAEIASGPTAFVEQLLPRHPDRVLPQRLPSGRVRYRLREYDGTFRYLTQEEMFVIRGLSFDGGVTVVSRVAYAAGAIGTALAAQRAQAKFFKSGMTAAMIATYKDEMDEEEESKLHASISRFAAGVENSFGLALVPDVVDIKNLGIEPEKAQMMLAQKWGVEQVALILGLPPSELGVRDGQGYGTRVQDALNYVLKTLRPHAITIEQSVQRDLILRKDSYSTEFKLEALLRGDPEAQAKYLTELGRGRLMWPSEGREILNLNPDPELDELWKKDFRPGESNPNASTRNGQERAERAAAGLTARAQYRYHTLVRDNALRCVRREKAAVEKLARKHADDPDGWQTALQDFYADHAVVVAQTMRMSIDTARGYAGQHGSAFVTRGLEVMYGEDGERWVESEADELAALSLDCEQVAA